MKTLTSIFSVVVAILAQEDTRVVAKIEAVVFPPLPRMARIQGDVRLRSGPDGVTFLSGHPLLAPVAVDNLKDIGKLSDVDIDVVYHFVLGGVSTSVTRTTVKKSNALTRFILHAFGRKTEEVVEYAECSPDPTPKNRIDITKNPVEVWIYGSGACLQTDATRIALRKRFKSAQRLGKLLSPLISPRLSSMISGTAGQPFCESDFNPRIVGYPQNCS